MAFLDNLGDDNLAQKVNEHWRKVAEYDRYVVPLLVRLEGIDWPKLIILYRARWQREAIDAIHAQKRKYGRYCWANQWFNPHTKAGRLIPRYPLKYGVWPVRLALPTDPAAPWGNYFKIADLLKKDYTPASYKQHDYETNRELVRQALENIDAEKRTGHNRRQYLADRLRSISKRLGRYEKKHFLRGEVLFYDEVYELEWQLNNALANANKVGALGTLSPGVLGEVEAKLELFRLCLREFLEAEQVSTPTRSGEPVPPDMVEFAAKTAPVAVGDADLFTAYKAAPPTPETVCYRKLADYDSLVLPALAFISPFAGGKLERWYIKQVIRRTYLAVTGIGFVSSTSTSSGPVMRQVLPPRPKQAPYIPRPALDKFGHPLPPLPRRFSKFNILRRVRPVLLATRLEQSKQFTAILAQYEQTLRRAADPNAAQAVRLKQCAQYLLNHEKALNIIGAGQIWSGGGQFEKLPTGQRYYFPLGWPVGDIAKLSAEIQLFDKLRQEFETKILSLMPPSPAANLDSPPTLKRVDYFPSLLTRLADAPIWDTYELLDEALAHYKTGEDDLLQGRKFIARLGYYLADSSIDTERRKRVESWALGAKQIEQRLISERMEPEWKETVSEDDRATLEHRLEVFTTTGRRLAQLEKQLSNNEKDSVNNERTIAQIEKRLAELNAAQPLETLTLPGFPAPWQWEKINVLAERIGLRKNGSFTPASNRVGAAVAGLIDALCEAGILPPTGELARLYIDFTNHYGLKIGADRLNTTRLLWQKKARQALELDS